MKSKENILKRNIKPKTIIFFVCYLLTKSKTIKTKRKITKKY